MIALILGGARSGKSELAERWAGGGSPVVTYVATMVVGDDADLATRVAAHRARRPAQWQTVEVAPDTDLPDLLAGLEGTVLVDSLGPWLGSRPELSVDADAICAALLARSGDTFLVSEEVGLGVHPTSAAGRQFRDTLGMLNQSISAIADQVVLVFAGRALPLVPMGTAGRGPAHARREEQPAADGAPAQTAVDAPGIAR